MTTKQYVSCITYEMFMRRALNIQERSEPKGACSSIYETLIRIGEGSALVDTSYKEQLATVKKYLNEALYVSLKGNLQAASKEKLITLKSRLVNARLVPDLDSIISEAVDAILGDK